MGNFNNDSDKAVSANEVDHPLAGNQEVLEQNGVNGDEPMLPVKIPIIGFETMEERAKFTIFKLRVENDKLDENWLVFRRYTDFVRLHSKLKEEIPEIEMTIPPKRWLRDNFETAFLEDRMKSLQAYVDSILVQPKLVALSTVRKFFCLDEPPVYSEIGEETKSWCGIIEDSSVMLRHKLTEKEQEIELLRAELALTVAQKDNLLKMAKSCRSCCQKQPVMSALMNLSLSKCSLSHTSCSTYLPSSGSSSEQGSPRHRTPFSPSEIVLNKRRSSTSSRKSSVQSEHKDNYFSNETYKNQETTINADSNH